MGNKEIKELIELFDKAGYQLCEIRPAPSEEAVTYNNFVIQISSVKKQDAELQPFEILIRKNSEKILTAITNIYEELDLLFEHKDKPYKRLKKYCDQIVQAMQEE